MAGPFRTTRAMAHSAAGYRRRELDFFPALLLAAVSIVLIRAELSPDILAGDILAMLAYALRVERAIDEVPSIVQQVGRLIDIRRRVRDLPSTE